MRFFTSIIFGALAVAQVTSAQGQINDRSILPESAISHKGCSHHEAKAAASQLPDHIKHKVPFPIQQHYHPLKSNVEGTAPADRALAGPYNIVGTTEGIHSAYIEFDENAGGIDYYAYAIGTTPGGTDIRWWQSMNPNRKRTYSHSMVELGLNPGDVFYYTIHAEYNNGTTSPDAYSGPMSFQWETLGDASYNVTVQFGNTGFDESGNVIAGWAGWEIAEFNQFLNNMLPIIKDVYGPPSRSNTVTLVRDLAYSNTNVYFQGDNKIHMDNGLNPQLLTHELLHAWRDNVIFAVDSSWAYDPQLSGFEESYAQGASYACMQRYYELYPNDPLVQDAPNWGSSMGWDYDFRNRPILTTEDFWSASNGTGIAWERYEVGAAAVEKAWLEDPDYFSKFNMEYYSRMNNDNSVVPTRGLGRDVFATVIPTVEETPTEDWVDDQRIFDCENVLGFKVYDNLQNYPSWGNHWIFNTLYYYETFWNGSEWAYYDSNIEDWVYYNQNGSSGTATLWDYNSNMDYNSGIVITPYDNPPVLLDMGEKELIITTNSTAGPWPGGDPNDFIFNVNDFGLYELEVDFPNASVTVPRVIGDDLIDTRGAFGGVLNDNGGELLLEHENHSADTSVLIVNGAFVVDRNWTGIANAITGYEDSEPGQTGFMYIDNDCNKYVDFRTIGWGSSSGNQCLLFDVNDMDPVTESAAFSYSQDGWLLDFTDASQVYSHPVFDFDQGDVTYSWDFGDGATSSDPNPTHQYTSSGDVNACLTVTNGCWSETVCETINLSLVDIKNDQQVEFEVYPNPTEDQVIVELATLPKNGRLSLRNGAGKMVYSAPITGTNTKIDLQKYAPGEYNLSVEMLGNQSVKQIIKSK